jgi:hypothetical protein
VLRQFSIEPHGIIRWRLDGTKKTVPWVAWVGLDQKALYDIYQKNESWE